MTVKERRKNLHKASFLNLDDVRKIVFLFFLGALTSCRSLELDPEDRSHAPTILRIGHGGMGFSSFLPWNPYPINSMTSLKTAMETHMADGLEVDLRMTKDQKFVLYHDRTLASATALDSCVELCNYKDLIELQYELGFPFDWFQKERIIGLEEFIHYLKMLDAFPHLHIDMRVHSPCLSGEENGQLESTYFNRLTAVLDSMQVPSEKVILNTYVRDLLAKESKKGIKYPLSLELFQEPEEGLTFAKKYDIPWLTLKPEILSQEFCQKARTQGVRIITFGGNSLSGNKQLVSEQADAIQSNNLKELNRLLLPIQ